MTRLPDHLIRDCAARTGQKVELPTCKRGYNKYGVTAPADRTDPDGVLHASRKQMIRWLELKLLERAGEVCKLRREVSFELMANGVRVGKYVADHTYHEWIPGTGFSEKPVIEDVKGYTKGTAYRLFTLKKNIMESMGYKVREVHIER